MTDYYLEAKKCTFALIDKDTGSYIHLSFFEGSDSSGYLTLDSSHRTNPDYIKISYHPKLNELRYAFTNELWEKFDKPNHERKKFVAKPSNPNQYLARIYIDKTALYRADMIDEDHIQTLFPDDGAMEVILSFENSRLTTFFHNIPASTDIDLFIEKSLRQVYSKIPEISGRVNGCIQAQLTGDKLPLRIVVFGV